MLKKKVCVCLVEKVFLVDQVMAAAPSSTSVPSPAVSGAAPALILHTRLSFLTNLQGRYYEQGDFFAAVDNGDVRARAAYMGSEGLNFLREWMKECRVELVSVIF